MHEGRPATAMVIDVRDFTPMFQDSGLAGETERFLEFLEELYRECVVASEATGARSRDDTLYTNSTGDGVLAVFLDRDWHAEQAYAAAVLLCHRLPRVFEAYGYLRYLVPVDSFGIGLESGMVHVVRATTDTTTMTTCIGNAINIAARLEAHTKGLFRTPLIIGPEINDLLSERLRPGFDYSGKVAQILDPETDEVPLRGLFAEMDELNRELRIKFINHLYLRGVEEPVAAFRYSPSLARGTEGIQQLFERLFTGEPARLGTFRALLEASMQPSVRQPTRLA